MKWICFPPLPIQLLSLFELLFLMGNSIKRKRVDGLGGRAQRHLSSFWFHEIKREEEFGEEEGSGWIVFVGG